MDTPKHVLYIEDDKGLAQIVQKRLQRLAYNVDLAYDSLTGLAKTRQKRYDVVVIDYDLPDHTGLEIINVIQQDDAPPPLIMVTAYSDPSMAVQALKNGALDYLVKDSHTYLEYLPTVIEQTLEQQRLIDEKRMAEHNRERLIQELDAFAHTVAHDLKSPLGIIINAALLLGENQADWDDQSKMLLDHIRLTGKKMLNIIEALLLLANMRQQDTMQIFLHEVDMKMILKDSLFRLEQILGEMKAQIVVPDELPAASGYGPWLEEVWVNYISNALKYGGTPPHIEIKANVKQNFVEYSVIDNGEGVPPDKQESLFIPFVRLPQSQLKSDGHGLGLSIVQRIIEQLDGEVGMENMDSQNQGARFWFRLPQLLPPNDKNK